MYMSTRGGWRTHAANAPPPRADSDTVATGVNRTCRTPDRHVDTGRLRQVSATAVTAPGVVAPRRRGGGGGGGSAAGGTHAGVVARTHRRVEQDFGRGDDDVEGGGGAGAGGFVGMRREAEAALRTTDLRRVWLCPGVQSQHLHVRQTRLQRWPCHGYASKHVHSHVLCTDCVYHHDTAQHTAVLLCWVAGERVQVQRVGVEADASVMCTPSPDTNPAAPHCLNEGGTPSPQPVSMTHTPRDKATEAPLFCCAVDAEGHEVCWGGGGALSNLSAQPPHRRLCQYYRTAHATRPGYAFKGGSGRPTW